MGDALLAPRMASSLVLLTLPPARTTASVSASRRSRRTPRASSLMFTLPRLFLVPSVATDNWKGAQQCSQSWECRGARLCERGGWCSGYDGCEGTPLPNQAPGLAADC